MILFLVLGLIIGAVSVVFVLQNIPPVDVNFLTWNLHGSLSVILLATLLVGMLISALVLLPGFISLKWQVGKANKRIKKLEDDAMINAAPVPSAVVEPAPVSSEPDLIV